MKPNNGVCVLIIDDDEGVVFTLASLVEKMGFQVSRAYTRREGLDKAMATPFDAIFLDVRLPDGNGLEIVRTLKALPSAPQVIIMTSFADPEGAELAMERGVWDYIEKPLSIQKVKLQIKRVIQFREETRAKNPAQLIKKNGIIGDSPQIRTCLEQMAKAAGSRANVLITGDTGTGKELFAKAIHANSRCAAENFIVVDCGVMTETLVESVLFGHEKGAYTGADKERVGLIRLAHKGTLFLDEVGELPPAVQTSFLRVLQERRFRPLGGTQEIESDFRVIAATNKDLDAMVAEGTFRKDLLYRLRSIILELPPLKDRKEDIKDLVLHYTALLCDRHGIVQKGFAPEFLEALMTYDWPGNVRELIHAIESAIATAIDEFTLFPVHLPTTIRKSLARFAMDAVGAGPVSQKPSETSFPSLREVVEKTEADYFRSLVAYTGGDVKQLCHISGLSRAMIYSRLKKYSINRHFIPS